MSNPMRRDLTHDLWLPTLLFAAIGAMSWAVRGSSGFGGSDGCIFAGVLWGTAWWFIGRDPCREPSRRYDSGWIVLALTVGIGLSGARGWMQWPSLFEGKLQTNYQAGEFVPISRVYGFIWLFIAGVPWAGIGACLLAWCGSLRETRLWHWAIRLACGIGGAVAAQYLFDHYPQFFLPLYDSIEERYRDLEHNPNLGRLIRDSGSAIVHMGFYLGLLAYEAARREEKNVVLILTVGLLNGVGWALLQNWKWAPNVWPGVNFNWWRCWESSGGISIGIAYGVAYFLVNRPMSEEERAVVRARRSIEGPNFQWLTVFVALASLLAWRLYDEANWPGNIYVAIGAGVAAVFAVSYCLLRPADDTGAPATANDTYGDPNLERFGLYLGLLIGLGFSLRSGVKGWFNIYYQNEKYWSIVVWNIVGPALVVLLAALCAWVLFRPLARCFRGDVFPHAARLAWLVLVWQNVLAQLVTGPINQWNEFAFNVYYLLLFAITAAIVIHYSSRSTDEGREST